jgi:hypothetical protein
MKPSADKNKRLEWETLFIVTHTVVPNYLYRQLMTMIHLAKESKHDNGFKIKAVTGMVNAACQQFGIFGKYLSAEMR